VAAGDEGGAQVLVPDAGGPVAQRQEVLDGEWVPVVVVSVGVVSCCCERSAFRVGWWCFFVMTRLVEV